MAQLTQTEFEMLYLRCRSFEDCEFILDMLNADGEITVVPDPSANATAARKKSKSAAKKEPATGAKVKRPTGGKVEREAPWKLSRAFYHRARLAGERVETTTTVGKKIVVSVGGVDVSEERLFLDHWSCDTATSAGRGDGRR